MSEMSLFQVEYLRMAEPSLMSKKFRAVASVINYPVTVCPLDPMDPITDEYTWI